MTQKWKKIRTISLALFLTLSAPGCATIVNGTTQSVALYSDPSGASCKLEREGQQIAAVEKTPETLIVVRDKDEILIRCNKEGYAEGEEILQSFFTGQTVGNILVGGGIGLVADMVTGANSEYPSDVTVQLIPKNFASIEERDIFFDRLVQKIDTEMSQKLKELNDNCNEDNRARCSSEIAGAEKERSEKLSSIETQRLNAVVAKQEQTAKADVPGA